MMPYHYYAWNMIFITGALKFLLYRIVQYVPENSCILQSYIAKYSVSYRLGGFILRNREGFPGGIYIILCL